MEAPHTGAFWFSFGAAVDLVTEIKPAGALECLKVHTLRSGPPVPNLGRVSKWFLVLNGVHRLFRSKLPDTANPTRGPTRLRTLLRITGTESTVSQDSTGDKHCLSTLEA